MDPDAVSAVDRVPHGGAADSTLLDFSVNTNPERPPGTTVVYDTALARARRYPADDYTEFRTTAADYLGVCPESVVPTAGALPALRLTLGCVVDRDESVAIPRPSFSEYEREVRLQGATPVPVAHDELLAVDPSDHAAAVVCNPNNPTGDAYETADLRAFAERCHDAETTLVVDEAFLDFTDRASMAEQPGVVVLRSLTKIFGIPGLRIGFAVATGTVRDRLHVARPAWGVSTPACDVGEYCLRQESFVTTTRERIRRERERLRDHLATRFAVYPSDAPFLLLRVRDETVADVVADAREAGIAVRDARTFDGLDSHVRVAVKRRHENQRLIDALT